MATKCRRKSYRIAKVSAYIILILLVVIGFIIGRLTAQAKTVTVTETVEVPVVEEELPEAAEVYYFDVPLSHSLQTYIYEVCAEEDVPVTLAMAMIEHESEFNADTVSSTNDWGLMQINEVNHERLEEKYRCADMLNPYQNVFCGVKIISSYISKYDDLSKALMAYNLGDYGANKAWASGIDSTDYSAKILSLMQEYEEELENERDNN